MFRNLPRLAFVGRLTTARHIRARRGGLSCPLSTAAAAPAEDLVRTTCDASTGIATVTLYRPPVNSLSLEMFQALSAAIKTAEADPSMQALVLQSHNPAVFSAGLDLLEMHQPNPDRLAAFWTAFQQLYLDLYGSRLSCIAAMEGAAPAAGCMLALSCDYRIMAATDTAAKGGKPTIGLNESRIGIVAPPFLARQFMDTIGRRQAELGLSLGTLYSSEQALAIGLVDQVLPRDEVRPAAQAAAAQWAQIPGSARLAAKLLVRGPALQELQANRQKDVDDFCAFITSARSQQGLTAYLELLAQKGKKKK